MARRHPKREASCRLNGQNQPRQAADRRDLTRRLRLGVLERKRHAVVDLRNANRIDDIVLRELQAAMDLEEVRLLGPPPTD